MMEYSRKVCAIALAIECAFLSASAQGQPVPNADAYRAPSQPVAAAPDIAKKAVSADPLWHLQWALHDPAGGIGVQAAWPISRGAGSVVAVVGTGITEHPDLAERVLPGFDFVTNTRLSEDGDGRDNDPSEVGEWEPGPCANYGTHLSGIIAAGADNGEGIAGIAPEAKILPVRVAGRCGGTAVDMGDGIVWAAGGSIDGVPSNPHPAKVIVVESSGPWPCDRYSADAIRLARNLGALVIVDAGDGGEDPAERSPTSCSGVVAVSAADRSGALAQYSNAGRLIHLSAPGGNGRFIDDDIWSTIKPNNDGSTTFFYASHYGTAMAAAHVAGVAALMRAVNPLLDPLDVRDILMDTARPMSRPCTGCGTGLLDAARAVEAARDMN
jgi:serine protease